MSCLMEPLCLTGNHKILLIYERPLMKSRSLCLMGLAAAATLLSSHAHAQAFGFYRSPVAHGMTQGGSAGLAVVGGRQYLGSDESRTMLGPTFDYQWANGVFLGAGNGLGINLSQRPERSYGLRLTADFGRDEKRSTALTGMGDIPARPEIGGFANFRVADGWEVVSSIRYGAGDDRKGLVVDVGLNMSHPLSPSLRLNAGVATAWANRAWAQSHFGVNTQQAANSGYAGFNPSAGLRDVRFGVALNYAIAPNWSLTGGLSVSRLLGDAKDSPIVRDRSSVTGVVSTSYRF